MRNVIPYPKRNTPTTLIGLEDFVFETCGGDHPLLKIITPGASPLELHRTKPNKTKPPAPHTTGQPLTNIQRTMPALQQLTQPPRKQPIQNQTKPPAPTPGTLQPYPDHNPHNAGVIPQQAPHNKQHSTTNNQTKQPGHNHSAETDKQPFQFVQIGTKQTNPNALLITHLSLSTPSKTTNFTSVLDNHTQYPNKCTLLLFIYYYIYYYIS